ncbi:Mo-dependent nitrogenase C-terminal domain-containing protein [Anabaena sp. UHCC 0451]|uniref:Mo-dependent nitrogenase C-terminal domain-containing protein n=1 Tax=Anabaena sp. UHCC 0451 TaxID=2055235 RepID=UPI002B21D678|nr:Mo-dependent nitrogenase C-terminal domain-containing protein [Anabaena sp. UHCC 0451]MEA5578310.1 Mo-dependent nitrogenase C-terminal domain-containing protein [Anabaena sp. UHCC 0451]
MASIPHSHPQPDYHPPNSKNSGFFDLLKPLRQLLNGIEVKNSRFAHFLCQQIPCCCPFERDIHLLGRTFHIPALCKINPLYDEVVALRFRALSYLADECGEDITKYIC